MLGWLTGCAVLAGKVLLPAANMRRQLLPLHGKCSKNGKKIDLFISKQRKKCPTRDFSPGFAANLPPRLEAGEHAAGRQPGALPQDLRLWLLQGAV